jgi:hypothetical protein
MGLDRAEGNWVPILMGIRVIPRSASPECFRAEIIVLGFGRENRHHGLRSRLEHDWSGVVLPTSQTKTLPCNDTNFLLPKTTTTHTIAP